METKTIAVEVAAPAANDPIELIVLTAELLTDDNDFPTVKEARWTKSGVRKVGSRTVGDESFGRDICGRVTCGRVIEGSCIFGIDR